MSFDTQILKDKIEGIKTAFENGQFADALVTAVNTGNGLMQQRIFTQNQDSEGNDFGQYIGPKTKTGLKFSNNPTQNKRNKSITGQFLTAYQKKRAAAGRQVIKKDLEFHGGLRRAIETVVEGENAAILEFNNSDAAIVAHGQEQQIANIRNGLPGTTKGIGAVKIFKLSTTEKEQVVEQGLELIKQVLKPKT